MREEFRISVISIVFAVAAFIFVFLATREERVKVTSWKTVHAPHQSAPVKIPARITWMGVEYECVLVEKE